MASAAGTVFLLLFLIARVRLHPALALMAGAVALGLASGMPLKQVPLSFTTGVANLMGYIAITLGPGMAQLREPLSLDPSWTPSAPDMSKTDPKLVGPILDLMTFYVDLWLMNKIGIFQHPGDHFYVPNPQPGSWADGAQVLVGKNHIDFDLNLQSIDPVKQTAVVVIHHVPPSHPNLQLPAEWMQTPVADTANNWVEVTKTKDGKYEAGVGKETFDVTMTVSTVDGRILSANIDNPVVMSGRECDDAALTKCGVAQPHTIHRQIEIALQH